MRDPYAVLDVPPSASDEEIKKAYRELARKYHPDNYHNNPLADLAQEKMKEINEAYEAILKERSGSGWGSSYGQAAAGAARSQYQSAGGAAGPYNDVRSAINAGDLNRAEMLLGSITDRGAEWFFLMGSLCYRRGWMDEAASYFQTAGDLWVHAGGRPVQFVLGSVPGRLLLRVHGRRPDLLLLKSCASV
jgi:hypothetical protein